MHAFLTFFASPNCNKLLKKLLCKISATTALRYISFLCRRLARTLLCIKVVKANSYITLLAGSILGFVCDWSSWPGSVGPVRRCGEGSWAPDCWSVSERRQGPSMTRWERDFGRRFGARSFDTTHTVTQRPKKDFRYIQSTYQKLD